MNMNPFNSRAFDMAMRNDLASFIQKVVSTVNPASPYRDNWHVWAIAWHLGRDEWCVKLAWTDRDVRQLDDERLAAILDVVTRVAAPPYTPPVPA